MTYQHFLRLLHEHRWSLAQLRCDVPPDEDLLDAMGEIGLETWERFVLHYERSQRILSN